mgnify:CR=1 FL=1
MYADGGLDIYYDGATTVKGQIAVNGKKIYVEWDSDKNAYMITGDTTGGPFETLD